MITVQSLFFFIKIFIYTLLFHKYLFHVSSMLFTTLRIITAATNVVLFYFEGQLWGGLTSTKNYFECCLIRTIHPDSFLRKFEAFIRRFSFKVAVLEVHRKHQQQNISSIIRRCQYVLCCKWLSRNFPKIFRTVF